MLETAKFYDRFSFFYPLVSSILAGQQRLLIDKINLQKPGELLEIGVGNGAQLKHYRAMKITGIDLSEAMLRKAARNSDPTVRLIRMNAEELSFSDQSFDCVAIAHTLAVTANPDKVLREAHRVLRSAGKLYILNHFTPASSMRLLDIWFQPIAKILKFRSVFYTKDLGNLALFKVEETLSAGLHGYFQLLILSKR